MMRTSSSEDSQSADGSQEETPTGFKQPILIDYNYWLPIDAVTGRFRLRIHRQPHDERNPSPGSSPSADLATESEDAEESNQSQSDGEGPFSAVEAITDPEKTSEIVDVYHFVVPEKPSTPDRMTLFKNWIERVPSGLAPHDPRRRQARVTKTSFERMIAMKQNYKRLKSSGTNTVCSSILYALLGRISNHKKFILTLFNR